jgi:hypothetical protein
MNTQPKFDGEKGEKDGKLTGSSPACSERPGEDRSGPILPMTGEKEVDMVIVVVNPDSIP